MTGMKSEAYLWYLRCTGFPGRCFVIRAVVRRPIVESYCVCHLYFYLCHNGLSSLPCPSGLTRYGINPLRQGAIKITKKRDGKFRREGVQEWLVLGERSSEFETITRLLFNNL